MQVLSGILYHFLGGFASGSFYMPYRKVRGWSWESYWIVGGLFSWLIVPPLAAWLTIPDFGSIIAQTDTQTLFYTYLFGLLWGIGGLTYGLGVRYLGVSLGSSIILGLCMIFGALIPSIFYEFRPEAGKDTISAIAGSSWGLTVLGGLAVCVLGIIICGRAGIRKERELNRPATKPAAPKPVRRPVLETVSSGDAAHLSAHPDTKVVTAVAADAHGAVSANTEFKFGLGLTLAIVSGVLSACFNFGLEAGKPMADVAQNLWLARNPGGGEFLFRNNVIYVVVLWGGLTTNLVWCLYLNARNKSFGDYTNKKLPLLRNLLFSALAGTTWFLQFFFYGMGESRLGNGASSWILHMSFIILIANIWGLVSKEWSGVGAKTRRVLFAGVATIIVSVLIVGYGNKLHEDQKAATQNKTQNQQAYVADPR